LQGIGCVLCSMLRLLEGQESHLKNDGGLKVELD
jgi:hypothetical protein